MCFVDRHPVVHSSIEVGGTYLLHKSFFFTCGRSLGKTTVSTVQGSQQVVSQIGPVGALRSTPADVHRTSVDIDKGVRVLVLSVGGRVLPQVGLAACGYSKVGRC